MRKKALENLLRWGRRKRTCTNLSTAYPPAYPTCPLNPRRFHAGRRFPVSRMFEENQTHDLKRQHTHENVVANVPPKGINHRLSLFVRELSRACRLTDALNPRKELITVLLSERRSDGEDMPGCQLVRATNNIFPIYYSNLGHGLNFQRIEIPLCRRRFFFPPFLN